MKKMKKLLTGIVAIVVLLGLTTCVNASNVTAQPSPAKKGETVTVTVSMAETSSVGVFLKYDADKFTFNSASSSIGELSVNDNNGVVKVAGSSESKKTTSVEFKFTAKDTTDAASFEVTRLVTESNEAVPASPATVAVQEPADQGTNTETDGTKNETTNGTTNGTTKGTTSGTTTESTSAKVDDQGNTITKLPQTGVPYVAIAGIALVAVTSAIIIKRK